MNALIIFIRGGFNITTLTKVSLVGQTLVMESGEWLCVNGMHVVTSMHRIVA